VHIGPSSDFSGIQAGMSEIRTKSDYPQAPLDVVFAAKHVIQNNGNTAMTCLLDRMLMVSG
jgi:hypothetical protein